MPLDYSVRTSATLESAQQTFSIKGDSNYLTIQEYFLAAASRNVSSRDQRSSLFELQTDQSTIRRHCHPRNGSWLCQLGQVIYSPLIIINAQFAYLQLIKPILATRLEWKPLEAQLLTSLYSVLRNSNLQAICTTHLLTSKNHSLQRSDFLGYSL
jgi:hypothetical protein